MTLTRDWRRFAKELRPKYRLWVYLSMVGVTLGLAIYAVKVWLFNLNNDFEVFYRTSQRFLGGQWDQIYTLADLYGLFRYPPVAIPLVGWLAFFPFQSARQLWFILNVSAWAFGLWLLHRELVRKDRAWAFTLAWAAALCTLRPMMDSLINSQIDGLMFFGLCLTLVGLIRGQAASVGTGIFIPSIFKIGTLVVSPMAFWRGFRFASGVLSAIVTVVFVGLLLLRVSAHSIEGFVHMLDAWWINLRTVLVPSSHDYVECLDFRSQALNSALLRAVEWGWWSVEQAHRIWLTASALGLSAWCLLVWVKRKTKPWWEVFGLAVLVYLIFMPFTYRRTLLFLALPAMALLKDASRQRVSRFQIFSLVFCVLTISIPGKDVVGEFLFLGIQKLSLPMLGMFFLAASLVQKLFSKNHKLPPFAGSVASG